MASTILLRPARLLKEDENLGGPHALLNLSDVAISESESDSPDENVCLFTSCSLRHTSNPAA
jgi:hypothetical protein